MRAGFSRSAHVVVENGGHEDLLGEPEVRAAILRFLAGELTDRRVVKAPLRFVPLDGALPGYSHAAPEPRAR